MEYSFYYIPVLIVNLYCHVTHVFAVFWSDEKDSSEFSLSAMNIQSNLSGSSQVHDLPPLQLETNLFSQFSAQASV